MFDNVFWKIANFQILFCAIYVMSYGLSSTVMNLKLNDQTAAAVLYRIL